MAGIQPFRQHQHQQEWETSPLYITTHALLEKFQKHPRKGTFAKRTKVKIVTQGSV